MTFAAEPPVVDDADPTLDDHPLVVAVDQRVEPARLLRLIQREVAKEAATLAFMAAHADYYAEHFDVVEEGRAVSRRVRQLKGFAELVVAEHRVLGPPPLDLAHPVVREVLDLLVKRIAEVGFEVLPAGLAAELEQRIRVALEQDNAIPWP